MTLQSTPNRSRLVLEISFLVLLCLGLAALAIAFDVFKKPATSHTITYRVRGSAGSAAITYSGRADSNSEPSEVSPPWEMTLPVRSGEEVYLTAANTGQTGDIECTILLDRKPWKKQSARAPDMNVACGGIVP
jgi:hypothetical protein